MQLADNFNMSELVNASGKPVAELPMERFLSNSLELGGCGEGVAYP